MRNPPRLAVLILAVTALMATAACGDDEEPAGRSPATTTTSAPSGGTTTTIAPGPTPTEPPGALGDSDRTGRSELADGRHFGYWKSFEIGDTTAFGEFDLAYFLSGVDAEAAAAAKGETVENDYFVVNDNAKLRTLVVAGNAEVRVLVEGGGADPEASNVADFAVDRHAASGFWVTIADGKVVEIEEQYVP
jgi:hypothetical protein